MLYGLLSLQVWPSDQDLFHYTCGSSARGACTQTRMHSCAAVYVHVLSSSTAVDYHDLLHSSAHALHKLSPHPQCFTLSQHLDYLPNPPPSLLQLLIPPSPLHPHPPYPSLPSLLILIPPSHPLVRCTPPHPAAPFSLSYLFPSSSIRPQCSQGSQ